MSAKGLYFADLIEDLNIPLESELLRLRGATNISSDDPKAGEADLLTSSELGNPLSDYRLAVRFADQGKWALAAEYFDRTQPMNSHVLNQYLDRLIAADRRSDAIQLADEYVSIHPNAPATYYRLANLHWGMGNREGTIQALAAALNYDPDTYSDNYRYQSARLEYLRGNYTSASQVIDELLVNNPNNFAYLYLAGLIHTELKDHSQAVQYLVAAKKQNPSHLYTHLALASNYMAQGEFSLAADEYQQASILASDPGRYLLLLADVYNQMGASCKAAETLRVAELVKQAPVDLKIKFEQINDLCSP